MRFPRLVQYATVVVAAALLLVQPASAQGFKWWQSERYKRELGLTVEQSKRMEEIFQAALPSLRAQKKLLDEVEAEFERIVARGDDATVMEQVGRLEAARAELNKTRTFMLVRMRRGLTIDQWARFGALHQAVERERAAAAAAGDATRSSKAGDTTPDGRGVEPKAPKDAKAR
jgi:Spy/CpxP family protein refolding chaperone